MPMMETAPNRFFPLSAARMKHAQRYAEKRMRARFCVCVEKESQSFYSSGISPMEKHIMLCRHQSLRRVRRMDSQHVYGCATEPSVRQSEKHTCLVRAEEKHSHA